MQLLGVTVEQSAHYWMQQALLAADSRRGYCAPNPAVGAVVVSADGELLATGCHWAAGCDHAEVDALKKAGHAALGATLYVTLEPCNHTGKTPPCTEAIRAAGIAKVYYGYADPNPQVKGSGAQALQAQGIACEYLASEDCADFYRSYEHWLRTGYPYFIAKLAQTSDGYTAQTDGKPLAITGPAAAELTAEGRRHADAILTTVKTVLADNPRLNCRLPDRTEKRPVYVLDAKLDFPQQPLLLQTAAEVVLMSSTSDKQHPLRCLPVAAESGRLSWPAIAQALGQEGLHEVWVETGPTAFQTLLQSGLLSEAWVFQSDQAAREGLPGVDLNQPLLHGAQRSEQRLGADTWIRYCLTPAAGK